MDRGEFQQRTKTLALRVVRLVRALPKSQESRVFGQQLLRSATSVAANYRASCRARSRSEFLAKLGIVEEEADETCFWLEMIIETELLAEERVKPLLDEANEVVAMVVASRKTLRQKVAT